MKKRILKTRVLLYLMLVVLTLLYGWRALVCFDDELENRTMPQAMRAFSQVSRLLPQLEENEQAVREMNDHFEYSRRQVYENNQGALKSSVSVIENAETVIDHTLSWMNRVTMLRVGRQGHLIVISKEDYTILAHPDEQFVGEQMFPVGDVDVSTIPDISEIGEKSVSDNFQIFFPSSFFREEIGAERLMDAADAGIYGTVFAYKDTYILCGTTLSEGLSFIIIRTLFTTLIFFVVAWILVRYIGFSLDWRKDSWKELRSKLTAYSVIALVVLFVVTWYYQTMMDMTGDIATMNEHAKVAVETLNTYREYRNVLSEWLDEQYLEQCRLAADLIRSRGRENLSRQELAKFAKELDVRYIYVFDKNGRTIVTNSPYDHFVISEHEEDQSYAFRALLDGREYLIQEPGKDESSGENMQYIGVSLRNEEDLADGFVQIAVDPALRERLLSPINVQTVLDNLVIGLPEYAMAIDKNTLEIVATTGLGFQKGKIEDLGIQPEYLREDFNGFFDIKGVTYYAGVSESEDLFLMPLTRSTDNDNVFFIALKLMLYCAAAFLLFSLAALSGYRKILKDQENETPEEAAKEEPVKETSDENEEDEERGIFSTLTDMIKEKEKFGFETRWKNQSSIPLKQQTPEMRTGAIIYRILLIFSIALILFEVFVFSTGMTTSQLDGFSYVLLGEWEKGVNLFAFSYCLFLLCILYVFQELVNRILYRIAKISDLKNETILLLLRNALKYSCALLFLYIGLAKFGLDTRALWASVGVLSLMIGFGAKDLISDIIAGLFIIFEGIYKIGDFVAVGSWFGTVEEIGIRYTKIRYFSEVKIFNNSSIRDIINSNGDVSREVFKFQIPYETDLLEVEKLLTKELPEMAKNIPGLVKPPRYQGVDSFEGSGIQLRIAIFCSPVKRKKALRALQREIKLLFDREKISIPYDHMVVKEYSEEENTYTYVPEEAESETGSEETGKPA